MLSNCGVIEDVSGYHGWRGKRTNGCWRRLGQFWCWERVWRRGRWGSLATSSGRTVWRKGWCKGRWKASGEGADQQRPGSRIWKNGPSWTLLLHHNWRPIGRDDEKSSKLQQHRWRHLTREERVVVLVRNREREREKVWRLREKERDTDDECSGGYEYDQNIIM